MGKLKGGTTIGGYLAYHYGNFGKSEIDALNIDADTLDGYDSSVGATGSTIALRGGDGDLYMHYGMSLYLNMSHGVSTRNSDTTFYSSTDDYIRKNNAAGMRTSLALDSYYLRNDTADTAAGLITFGAGLSIFDGQVINHNNTSSFDKIRLWNTGTYSIGMASSLTYGDLNGYAITFTNSSGQVNWGFLWRGNADTVDQGAMALTVDGRLTVDQSIAIGASGQAITEFSIDGLLSGNSDTAVPTEKAVKTYVDNNAGLSWQVSSTSLTVTNGNGYMMDISSSSLTVTAIASPSVGDIFAVSDLNGLFSAYPVTIARNSSNIMGIAEDMVLDSSWQSVQFVYSGATQGWVIVNITPLGVVNAGTQFENDIINGMFDIWQRGTSQTSNGYGSDDRWRNFDSGSSKTHSRQAFTVGQTDVPGNPKYFSRTVVVTSIIGTGNYVYKDQKIGDVTKYSGERVCIVFYAKASGTLNLSIDGGQLFDSAETDVSGISAQKVALTTSWQKFVVFIDFPALSGEDLGNDNCSRIRFWFDAGSDFNSKTDSLGNQSGTFDIANVASYISDVELPVRVPTVEETLDKCLDYYQQSWDGDTPVWNNGYIRVNNEYQININFFGYWTLHKPMRIAPSTLFYSRATGAVGFAWDQIGGTDRSIAAIYGVSTKIIGNYIQMSSNVPVGRRFEFHWSADAEI